jgi:hypothetical protein
MFWLSRWMYAELPGAGPLAAEAAGANGRTAIAIAADASPTTVREQGRGNSLDK